MITSRLIRRVFLALLLSVIFPESYILAQPAQKEFQPQVGQEGKDVIWVPTPQALVDKMLDMAKVTHAETVGPYAYSQFESLFLLGDIAFNVVKYLERKGHKAFVSYDTGGLASGVRSSRGTLPDLKANRFAAVLAGLG